MAKVVEISVEAQLKDRLEVKQEDIEELFAQLFSIIPIKYEDLNKKFNLDSTETAVKLDKEFPTLTIGGSNGDYWISSFSVISTITRILTGKPLAFVCDNYRNLIGVRFLSEGGSLETKNTFIKTPKAKNPEITKKPPVLNKDNLFNILSDREKFKEVFAVEVKKDEEEEYQSKSAIYDLLVHLVKTFNSADR